MALAAALRLKAYCKKRTACDDCIFYKGGCLISRGGSPENWKIKE
jgi:hypothetical protein